MNNVLINKLIINKLSYSISIISTYFKTAFEYLVRAAYREVPYGVVLAEPVGGHRPDPPVPGHLHFLLIKPDVEAGVGLLEPVDVEVVYEHVGRYGP